MKNFLDKFVQDCKHLLGENLICILLLGSVLKQDATPFSDLDLIIIVRTSKIKDFREIRELLREARDFVDIPILCWDEIPKNPNQFRMGTHGCYWLELILKKARPLCGKNILLELSSPSRENIRLSVLEKVREYTWWVRRTFVESNRVRTMESNYQLNSRLVKMARDVMYLAGYSGVHTTATETIRALLRRHRGIFSKAERKVMSDLSKRKLASQNAADMSEEYFEIRLSIINKLHKIALRATL